MPTNSRAILLVGGAGFIGSHMILSLKEAGFYPVVLDNLSKGHAHAVYESELVVGNMGDKNLLKQLFAAYDFMAVLHFAGFIDVAESVHRPDQYYQNNVANTLALLEIMIQHTVRTLIFSSSAAVYGDANYLPIDEAHRLSPTNPYGRSKWMVEEIIRDYANSFNLRFAILRYFNAAGADPMGRLGEHHLPESHLIPLALHAAVGERDSLTIYGRDYPTPDGTCVRDYVHVTDVCDAHLRALHALLDGQNNMLYNLGTGYGYSVQQVIATAEKVAKRTIVTKEGERRSGDVGILIANPQKIMRELHWQPRYIDLEIIIQHAWQFIRNSLCH